MFETREYKCIRCETIYNFSTKGTIMCFSCKCGGDFFVPVMKKDKNRPRQQDMQYNIMLNV